MNFEKKTPAELRKQLIDGLMQEIIPGLKYKFNDHEFPLHFIKLGTEEMRIIVVERSSETDRFGKIRNEWLKQFVRPAERELINKLHNLIWWPAVDGVWCMQCYEVRNTTTPHINDLYILVRTSPDEWVGVQTKRCYLEE